MPWCHHLKRPGFALLPQAAIPSLAGGARADARKAAEETDRGRYGKRVGMTHSIRIIYCTQCAWMLRAAWVAQELLTTFQAVSYTHLTLPTILLV